MAMTHDELITKMNSLDPDDELDSVDSMNALRAVVELHKVLLVKDYENDTHWYECQECTHGISPSIPYPCQTIQAIEKELS